MGKASPGRLQGALVILAAFGLLAWSASGLALPDPPEGEEVPAEALEKAREAARALGGELMGRLLAELREGGPAEAVRVCSEVAQEMASAHSGPGLAVRRVSLRVRNPADRPDAWERAELERLAVVHGHGALPEEVAVVRREEGERRLRYLKPIVVREPCLACHGRREEIAPAVQRVLDERYPDDEATGYAAGDLRGAVSVTVALGEGTGSP